MRCLLMSPTMKTQGLCLNPPHFEITNPVEGRLMNSATKARPISSCSIVPNGPGIRRPNQALVEAYTHYADRRDAKGQMSLFTPDTHFVVYMNAKDPTPSMELHSRNALAPVFADLNRYDTTTHFVGQRRSSR